MTQSAFDAWGWRIPFLLSAVLLGIGLWIRSTISESPVFEAEKAAAAQSHTGQKPKMPALEVLTTYRREVLVALGARFAESVSYVIFTVFILTYATKELDLSRGFALNAVLVASALHLVVIPLFGALSDRVGRRPVYTFGAVGVGAWAFVFFVLLDTKSWALFAVAAAVGLFFHAAMYGPQAAFFSELFGTGVRYSGASMGYQLASVFAGSLAPIISLALLSTYGSSLPISFYLLGSAVLTIVALYAARETAKVDLTAVSPDAHSAPARREPEAVLLTPAA
jgi:MFS family permease